MGVQPRHLQMLWAHLQRSLAQQNRPCVFEGDGSGAAWNGAQLLAVSRAAADLLQRAAESTGRPMDPGPRVCGIYLSNSAAYVAAVLAALRLGLVSMPLDPSWPSARLQQACAEARTAAVYWSAADASCGGHGRPPVEGVALVQLPALDELLQQEAQQQRPEDAQPPAAARLPPEPRCCYLLHTSGSTGRPLGVLGTEAGSLNRCRWMQRVAPFREGDCVAFTTSPCFVDSIWELFGPLLAGASLLAVPQRVARDAAQLLSTLAAHHVTHLVAVPTLWQAMAAAVRGLPGGSASLCLRLAVSSGEPLSLALLQELQQRLLPAHCSLWNLYGCTEVAADCTAFDCTAWRPAVQAGQEAAGVPVGQPIDRTLIAVVASRDGGEAGPQGGSTEDGSQLAVASHGSTGQVAVAGICLAAGYLEGGAAAAAAQRQRFVAVPTSVLQRARQEGRAIACAADFPAAAWEADSMQLFLTGDLGWLDAAGCLHLEGRRDLQVKIAGVRVDLSEVELVLSQHPAVAAAAACLWQLAAGPVLAAYVELRQGQEAADISAADLQHWCQQQLPPAAVPRRVAVLPRLPRSAAGKVQRSQLPGPPSAAAAEPERAPSFFSPAGAKRQRTAAASQPAAQQPLLSDGAGAAAVSELAVSRAFAAALGHSGFEATSNLFALGGNSLMAAQIAGRVAGGRVEDVFQHPTVRSLAAFLNSTPAAAADEAGGQPAGSNELQQPPAALASARHLDVSGGSTGPPRQQQQHGEPSRVLRMAWRARMRQCVDAAPLVPLGAAASPAADGQERRIFACSHGGDVACYDASSGRQLWQTLLPDRTDAGLALCWAPEASANSGSAASASRQAEQPPSGLLLQEREAQGGLQYLAAGTNGGALFFLAADSGGIAGSVDAGGGIRAPPACDPGSGLVWQPTHGRQLVVAAAPGRELARLPLPAAASTAVSFAAVPRLALVCCLDGSVLAVSADSLAVGGSAQLRTVWLQRCAAPVFVPAALLCDDCLAVAAVDGSVTALRTSDGARLWQADVGGAVFAPLLPYPQGLQQWVLLAGSQSGRLVAMDASSGRQLAAVQLGGKVTGLQRLGRQRVALCLASGLVAVADLTALLRHDEGEGSRRRMMAAADPWLLDAARLPGDVFAPPATVPGNSIVVGCRDDYLYHLAFD